MVSFDYSGSLSIRGPFRLFSVIIYDVRPWTPLVSLSQTLTPHAGVWHAKLNKNQRASPRALPRNITRSMPRRRQKDPVIMRDCNSVILRGPSHDVVKAIPQYYGTMSSEHLIPQYYGVQVTTSSEHLIPQYYGVQITTSSEHLIPQYYGV